MMARATQAMTMVPAPERDISSLTLCLSTDGLLQLEDWIRAFRRELLELCESEASPSQVVQVNFQLFHSASTLGRNHDDSAPETRASMLRRARGVRVPIQRLRARGSARDGNGEPPGRRRDK